MVYDLRSKKVVKDIEVNREGRGVSGLKFQPPKVILCIIQWAISTASKQRIPFNAFTQQNLEKGCRILNKASHQTKRLWNNQKKY